MPLVMTMLLPLGIGLLVDAWFEPLTNRLLPILNKVSSAALVVLLAATVLTNYKSLLSVFGTGGILAALLVIAGAFAAGHVLLGRSDPAKRNVVALGTAQRNIAAATVVATQSFGDPRTLVMVVVTSIVSMALLFPIARIMGRRRGSAMEVKGAAVLRKSPLV
jgi:BASS family bile acid:Na+ symporter